MRRASIPLFFALPAVFCACASHELDSQREQWEAARPAHYSFTYVATGFSPHLTQRIEISGGQVVSSACEGTITEPCEGFTIDEVFDRVERSLDDAKVKYDSQWHFPADVYWDQGEEGYGFVIQGFAKLE